MFLKYPKNRASCSYKLRYYNKKVHAYAVDDALDDGLNVIGLAIFGDKKRVRQKNLRAIIFSDLDVDSHCCYSYC